VYLVTGGTGLLGKAVQQELSPELKKHTWVFLGRKAGDIRDPAVCRRLFEQHRPTYVIHLAARVGGLFANMADQIGFFQDNSRMNENLINLCHEFKVKRAIFCLSTCVFPAEAALPLKESSIHLGPPHPSNEGYAMAKRMLECLVRFHREAYNSDFVCIVPTNLYGPHDNFNLKEAHVMPALIHKTYLAKKEGSNMTVAGTGKPLRQFLYAPDAGRIILELLKRKDRIPFPSVILCGDEEDPNSEVSIDDIAKQVKHAMGFKGELVHDTSKADGIYRKTASNKLLRWFLGKEFKYTPLATGIKTTVDWFVDNYNSSNIRK